MSSQRRKTIVIISLLAVVTALALISGLTWAQPSLIQRNSEAVAVAAGSDYIPIQGQLTSAGGTPLNGDFSMTFRLYDQGSGGTALCTDMNTVHVTDGLFNTFINGSSCPIDGRQLYLSIQVESEPEMTPRQFIDNVPYAWSLRPGALIRDDRDDSVLTAENQGAGPALTGMNISPSSGAMGVRGTSLDGSGVQGEAFAGVGVLADSFAGVALRAEGTGIVQSTAPSYVWISGNSVLPFHQSDSTIIDMNTTGGARIYRGAVATHKNVMLPITVPGELYGQDVTVTDLDIYWSGDTDFEAIAAVVVRRQTGVCSGSSCYATMIHDTVDHICEDSAHPTGCSLHYDLSANNVLSSSSGILYLTIELGFSSPAAWIDFGGVRLTLGHE